MIFNSLKLMFVQNIAIQLSPLFWLLMIFILIYANYMNAAVHKIPDLCPSAMLNE